MAVVAYQPDTEIFDVEDLRAPELPRVPTKDLAVHVLVEGYYHRRHPRLAKTSCGMLIHSEFDHVRREELRHPLSRDCPCFTPLELQEADDVERSQYPDEGSS